MPNVIVEWVEGRGDELKADVARRIVEALHQAAGVPPGSTNVLFRDYGAADWFIGNESIAAMRARQEQT